MFRLKPILLFIIFFQKDEVTGNLENRQNISVMDLVSGLSYTAKASEAKSIETSAKAIPPSMIATPDEFSAEEATLESNPSKRSVPLPQKQGKKAITAPTIPPLLVPKSNRLAVQSGRMFEPSKLAKKGVTGRTLQDDEDSDESDSPTSGLKSKSKSSYVTVSKWSSGNGGEDFSSEDSPMHVQFTNSTKAKNLFASSILGPQLAKFKQNGNNKVTINRYSSTGGNSSKSFRGKLGSTNFGGVTIPNFDLGNEAIEVEGGNGGVGEDSNGMMNIPGFGKGKILSYKKTTKVITKNFNNGYQGSQSMSKSKSKSFPQSPSKDKIMDGLTLRKTGQGKPGGRSLVKARKNYETPLKSRNEPAGIPAPGFKPGGRALGENNQEESSPELPRHAILASQTGRMLGASMLAPKPVESEQRGRSLVGANEKTTEKPKQVAAKLPGAKKHNDLKDDSNEDMPKVVEKKPKNSLLAPSILVPKHPRKQSVD